MINLTDNENSLIDVLEHVESFEVFSNGEKIKIDSNQFGFYNILINLKDLFSASRLMPAFGVSMHNEILYAIKQGEWFQINFNKQLTKNDLPFNSLLFEFDEVQGFNLIRKFNNEYSGRCLYLDLDNMVDLKQILNIS